MIVEFFFFVTAALIVEKHVFLFHEPAAGVYYEHFLVSDIGQK